ncbi:MAG: hypothetical protein ACKO34_05575, partial [Vampirovibrionales bacterium]
KGNALLGITLNGITRLDKSIYPEKCPSPFENQNHANIYSWHRDNGNKNIGSWIETAHAIANMKAQIRRLYGYSRQY